MGMTDVLRTRADNTGIITGSEEMRLLREQVEALRDAHAKTTEDVNTLKTELEKVKSIAAEAEKKAKRLNQELQDSIRKNRELKYKLREERLKTESTKPESTAISRSQMGRDEPEPMEVEVAPSEGATTTSAPAPSVRPQITKRDLAEFPALRPPIKGKVAVIPDTPRGLPPPEIVEEERRENHKVSKKRKKGDKKAQWDQMESFSSTEARPKKQVATRMETMRDQRRKEEFPPLPPANKNTPNHAKA